jgi:ribonuclease T2
MRAPLQAGLFALALPLSAGGAQAQAYQCRVPQAQLIAPPVKPDGPARRIPVAGYTLALSWSPEYCRTRAGDAGDATQCSGRNGRFGFVVHGLWPESRAGAAPQWCSVRQSPTPETLRQNLCMMPSTRLLAHEWAKHGSCMVRSPESYFKVTRILWRSLRLPDLDRISRQPGLTAGAVRQAFADANPAWRAGDVGLMINERGWLEEMRLCYGKDFMPVSCRKPQFGPADAASVKIWRGL